MLKNLKFKAEEEEEEEQCSPVSVLGSPFDDDDDGDDDVDGFDIESSYAIVQSNLFVGHKLRRFEKPAELDPSELEKRMLEQGDDNDDLWEEEEEEEGGGDYECAIDPINEILKQVVSQSDYSHQKRIPSDRKRLITDLISEEETETGESNRAVVVKRVCRRSESWKEDMMVDQDIRTKLGGWNRTDQQQLKETALDIELAIFGLLMEELSQELIV